MPALKVYALGNHGFVSREISDAVGAGHHGQARVIIVAASKRAAIELAEAVGAGQVATPSMSDGEFRVAMGNDVDALAEAGLLAEPGIMVAHSQTRGGDPIARVTPDGFKVIGEYVREDGYRLSFIPKES